MKEYRIRKTVVKKSKFLDELTFRSKNLYNYVNYNIRQTFFETGKIPKEFDFVTQMRAEKQFDYMQLPSATSGYINKTIFKNWKGYFAALRAYKKDPSKFKERPKMPNYKHKEKGRNIVIFGKSNQLRKADGGVYLPNLKKFNLPEITGKEGIEMKDGNYFFRTDIEFDIIKEMRIVPNRNGYFAIEIVYEVEVKKSEVDTERYIGIDMGIDNLMAVVGNFDAKTFILDGKILKSYNANFNKKRAKLQGNTENSKSKKLSTLLRHREGYVSNYMHQTSKAVVDYCVLHKVGNIVIGKNVGWKQDVNIGKVNNQKFINIPHATLINMVRYKAEAKGIKVIEQEEAYTSKCSAYDKEPIKKHEKYAGRRVKRGLFKTKEGKLINADINGAVNILRKVIGDDFIKPNSEAWCSPDRIYSVKNTISFSDTEAVG